VDQDAVAITRDPGRDHHGAAGVVEHADVRQDRVVEETVQFGPVGDRSVVHAGQCRVGHDTDATGLSGSFREPESALFPSQYRATMTRHARPVELPLSLAPSGAALRHRVSDALIDLLRTGHLRPGDTLPATRALAAELAISRTAVLAAYDELAAAGFVHAVGGSCTVVSPGADLAARAGVSSHVVPPGAAPDVRPDASAGPRWNLLPGYPDTGLIMAGSWRAAWRAAAAQQPPPSGLPFGPGSGFPSGPLSGPLRQALAVHLRRTRGVAADPADIILVPGVSAGLRALTAAAALAGRPVAFEEPGYAEGRRALQSAGAVIRPVPVDDEGLDPADLDAGDAAAYTTPAHQFPLGGRLSAARRAALIGWARRAGALVIEDDYDGEFRYDVRGLPALHSMTGGPDVVAYLGTASKILSPGLRVAWLIAPLGLRQPVRDALERTDERISAPAGDALAHFIASGHLTAHLARASRTYAARRHALIAGLRDRAPQLRITGVDAGLHLVADLPAGADEAEVQRRLAQAGLAVDVLGQFGTAPLDRRALVCGYALLPETQAAGASAAIAAAVGPG
jgi:GntR family transcriptional regulator / MocR family aminotransferase